MIRAHRQLKSLVKISLGVTKAMLTGNKLDHIFVIFFIHVHTFGPVYVLL